MLTIDFLKYRYASAVFSALIFLSLIGAYVYKYQTRNGEPFNYSVDFTGGIQVQFRFEKPVTGEQLIKILEGKGWSGVAVREFSPTEQVVRVKLDKMAEDVKGESETMREALQAALGDNKVSVEQTDSVGSGMGSTLRSKSIYAVVLSLILILFYIAVRFWSFAFAMGAVVSLFHDAIVVFLAFLITDKEISMSVVGAILTVLGYSINDTIVVFSRVRENIKKHADMPIYDVINLSINETLRRTILTTFATTLVVIALFIFGGDILRDLSLALLIGIVFGIYSTLYIANPVLLMLYKKQKRSAV